MTRTRRELLSLTDVADRLAALTADQAAGGTLPGPDAGLGDHIVLEPLGNTAPAGTARRCCRRPQPSSSLAAGVASATFFGSRPQNAPVAVAAVPSQVSVLTDGVRASAGMIAHGWGVEIKLKGAGFTQDGAYDVEVVDERSTSAGRFIGTGDKELNCNLNSAVKGPDAARFVVRDDTGGEVLSGML